MADTFEEKVALAVKDGITDDTSPEVKYAAGLEKRRRDTQSEYSKNLTALQASQAENEKLSAGWATAAEQQFTQEQRTELDTLKAEDPDAWHNKRVEYSQANRAAFDTTRAEITVAATATSEAATRANLLASFVEANPEITLTDDVITNDLPPRYLKELESGKATFEEFLNNAKTYLTAGKVVAPIVPVVGDQISLSKAAGSAAPSNKAVGETNPYGGETY